MTINLKLFLLISLFNISLTSFAANNIIDLLPEYQHLCVRDQLSEYRNIYDEIYYNAQKSSEDPYYVHSSRLFAKLNNAFSLVREYIKNSIVFVDDDKKEKSQKKYLTYLETLYKSAQEINDRKLLSPINFEKINLICALIGSEYMASVGAKCFSNVATEIGLDSSVEYHLKDVYSAISFIQTGLDIVTNFLIHGHKSSGFYPMAIVYTKKGSAIGYKTFTEEYFNPPYSMFLSLFFPIPTPNDKDKYFSKKRSKSEVHYSSYKDLFSLMWHDYLHRGQIQASFANIVKEKLNISSRDYFQRIYDYGNTIKDKEEEYILLYTGLFYLTHEISANNIITSNEDPMFKEIYEASKQKDFFAKPDFLEYIVKCAYGNQKSALENLEKNPYNSYSYNLYYRDDEYMLIHAKKHNGKPYIPFIDVNKKNKQFLPLVENQNGKWALVISPFETKENCFEAISCVPNLEQEIISYSYYDGNCVLESWNWKNLTEKVIDKDKPDICYFWRKKLAAIYLQKAFEEFWNDFLSLAKQAYPENM